MTAEDETPQERPQLTRQQIVRKAMVAAMDAITLQATVNGTSRDPKFWMATLAQITASVCLMVDDPRDFAATVASGVEAVLDGFDQGSFPEIARLRGLTRP